MTFLEEIKQRKPAKPMHRAMLNVIYTYNWYTQQTADIFRKSDLTPQQYTVLQILNSNHPEALSAGEVKELLIDKSPDLTRLCDRLLFKGLIERQTNPGNRRQVLLRITNAGIELLKQTTPAIRKASDSWNNLTDEEAESLSFLLDKLRG